MRKWAAVLAAAAAVIAMTLAGLVALDARRTADVDLRTLVTSHVDAMPARNSAEYRPPTSAHRRTVARAWDEVVAGRLVEAEWLVEPLGYEIRSGRDPSVGPFVALHGPGGLFVHAPEGVDMVVVEVPHPRADRSSETFGLDLFRQAKAGVLLVAGAHRSAGDGDSADVSRRDGSVFQAVHRSALSPGSTVIQVHGYASHSAPTLDAIVSSGADPTPSAASVERAMSERFRTCLWSADGPEECRNLGGTRNVQGATTREAGAFFVHLELAPPLRLNRERRRAAVELVAKALAQA